MLPFQFPIFGLLLPVCKHGKSNTLLKHSRLDDSTLTYLSKKYGPIKKFVDLKWLTKVEKLSNS